MILLYCHETIVLVDRLKNHFSDTLPELLVCHEKSYLCHITYLFACSVFQDFLMVDVSDSDCRQ